jgi:hypothetical protein
LNKANGQPLHRVVHYRRLKELILDFVGKEPEIDINQYDLEDIKAFYTYGHNLKGHNVTYNTKNGGSPWVMDNFYEFYEIPNKSNSKDIIGYGKYLFLAFNTDFKYHLFGIMTAALNKEETISQKRIIENIHFKMLGRYQVTYLQGKNKIYKSDYGNEFEPGKRSDTHTFAFDSFNDRKLNYKTDIYKILSKIDKNFTKQADEKKIVSGDPVKIYKNKKSTKAGANRPNRTTAGSTKNHKKI